MKRALAIILASASLCACKKDYFQDMYKSYLTNETSDTIYVSVNRNTQGSVYIVPPNGHCTIDQNIIVHNDDFIFSNTASAKSIAIYSDAELRDTLFAEENKYEDHAQRLFFDHSCDKWTESTEDIKADKNKTMHYRIETFHFTTDLIQQ